MATGREICGCRCQADWALCAPRAEVPGASFPPASKSLIINKSVLRILFLLPAFLKAARK